PAGTANLHVELLIARQDELNARAIQIRHILGLLGDVNHRAGIVPAPQQQHPRVELPKFANWTVHRKRMRMFMIRKNVRSAPPDRFERAVDEEQITRANAHRADVVNDSIERDFHYDPSDARNFSSARMNTHTRAASANPPQCTRRG